MELARRRLCSPLPPAPLVWLSRRPRVDTSRHRGVRLQLICAAIEPWGGGTSRAAVPASGKPDAPHDGGELPVSTRVDLTRRGRSHGRDRLCRPPAIVNRAHRDPASLNAWRKGRRAAIGGPNGHPGGGGSWKSNVASPYYRAIIIVLND